MVELGQVSIMCTVTVRRKAKAVRPDAWGRFERAIDTVVKVPPQHWASKGPAKPEKIREDGGSGDGAKQTKDGR
jgi:hypothetical protein